MIKLENSFLCQKIGIIDQHSDDSNSYTVISTYRLIWKSNDQKGKVRLRQYIVNNHRAFFLENKYKQNGQSYKIRIAIDEITYKELRKPQNLAGIMILQYKQYEINLHKFDKFLKNMILHVEKCKNV